MSVIRWKSRRRSPVPEFEVEDMPVTVAVDSNGESVHETGPKEWRVKIESISSA